MKSISIFINVKNKKCISVNTFFLFGFGFFFAFYFILCYFFIQTAGAVTEAAGTAFEIFAK